LFPKDLRFEHGGGNLVSCIRRHLLSLRPCAMHITIVWPKWRNLLQKYLPISSKLSITKYLKQKAVDCRSHLTIENNLKVEKRYMISKTSTTFPSPKTTLEVRLRVETNIPKNSKAIIILALCPRRCFLHHKGIANDQTIFFRVKAGNVKFAMSQ